MTDFSSSFGIDGGAGDRPVPLHHLSDAPPPPQGEERAARFGRGWVPVSRDIGIPGEQAGAPAEPGTAERFREREGDGPRIFSSSSGSSHSSEDDDDTVTAPLHAWDASRKVRFLDHLSRKGDVRSACARVGMSRTSAYVLRRRDAVFARGWRAALVLARAHVEEVLATRALDGVEEAVWFRGELVGTRRRYDTRLLLAHLARLDAASGEEDAGAERFDEVLALVAGADAGAHLSGLAGPVAEVSLPPEREDYVGLGGEADFVAAREAWLDEVDAIDAAAGYVPPLDDGESDCGGGEAPDYPPSPRRAAFVRARAAQWDGWRAHAFACVDAALGLSGSEGAMEYKSLDAAGLGLPACISQDRVNCVNLTARRSRGTNRQNLAAGGNALGASWLSSVKAGAALPPPPPSCAGRPFFL